MKEITTQWIFKAEGDYRSAKILGASGEWDTACYHLQQSAEKYLKSILAENDIQPLRTHDLVNLVKVLQKKNILDINRIKDPCIDLNNYGVETRYLGYTAGELDYSEGIALLDIIKSEVEGYLNKINKMDVFDK